MTFALMWDVTCVNTEIPAHIRNIDMYINRPAVITRVGSRKHIRDTYCTGPHDIHVWLKIQGSNDARPHAKAYQDIGMPATRIWSISNL